MISDVFFFKFETTDIKGKLEINDYKHVCDLQCLSALSNNLISFFFFEKVPKAAKT